MFTYIFFGIWFILPLILFVISDFTNRYDAKVYSSLATIGFVTAIFGVFLYNIIPDCGLFTAFIGGHAVILLIALLKNR